MSILLHGVWFAYFHYFLYLTSAAYQSKTFWPISKEIQIYCVVILFGLLFSKSTFVCNTLSDAARYSNFLT